MKKLLGLLGIIAAVLGVPNQAAADSYNTSWVYTIDYVETRITSTSGAPTQSSNILMPSGSRWSCIKDAPSLSSSGIIIGGFTCQSGGVQTFIRAYCFATKQDASYARGAVAGSVNSNSAVVQFTVSCETTHLVTQ